MTTRLVVPRSDLAAIAAADEEPPALVDGQVRMTVDLFGLSSNNISYALFGDALGYWAFFPVDAEHGCIPVWGFADVAESRHADVVVGSRVFGYLPMATELVVRPEAVDALGFTDATPHRAALHPWYNRYYRCDGDPLRSADGEAMQATMWALFMTGWALADELAGSVASVVVSSASSKTALSLAWTLRQRGGDTHIVGVTSETNRAFVEGAGVYDIVTTYDALQLEEVTGAAAFVDTAGSPAIRERIHTALGDRLSDSVALGATHQGAGAATGELVGPAPRFFFIPDVAEQQAEETSLDAFHRRFADAWERFAPWIDGRLHIRRGSGSDEIVAAYRDVLGGRAGPDTARVLTW